MTNTIYAYGTGEAVNYIFNGIAMVLNGNGKGLLKPLFATGSLIGLTYAIAKMFYSQTVEPILRGWLVPVVLGYSMFFIPTTSVFINDPITKFQRKVDNIPVGLATVASFFSKTSHELTVLLESAFALPDDLSYHKNGSMYASKLIYQSGRQVIHDGHIKDNFNRFVAQCVIPEAMMGRKYDRHDLRTSKDLWALMKDNASEVRSVMYAERKKMGEIVSCSKAAASLDIELKKAVNHSINSIASSVFGYNKKRTKKQLNDYIETTLPSAMAHIADINDKNGEEFLKQMIVMDGLLTGADYGKRSVGAPATQGALRALLQQRTTFATYGILASQLLPVVKGVVEALLYILFIFLIPVSLVQLGMSAVTQWIRLVAWVSLWPPLCAVINCMSTYMCSDASKNLLMGEEVSFATNVALLNIQQDWMGMCNYISLFGVPTLAWALASGSQHAITQIAGGLTGATQGIGASAASDAASGNFNAGNVHMASQTMGNVSRFQSTTSPQMHGGAITMSDGQISSTLSADGRQISSVSRSSLPTQLNISETAQSQVSAQISDAESQVRTHSEALQESQVATYQSVIDKGMAEQKDASTMEGVSASHQASKQSSASKMASYAKQIASDNNVSDKTASVITAGVGVGLSAGKVFKVLQKFGVGIDTQATADISNAMRQAENMNSQDSFQENFQDSISESRNTNQSQTSSEVRRFNESISSNHAKAINHQEQLQIASSRMASLQNTKSAIATHASSINQDASQGLIEYVAKQTYRGSQNYTEPMGHKMAVELAAREPEQFQAHARKYAMEKAQGIVGRFSNDATFTPHSMELPKQQSLDSSSVQNVHNLNNDRVRGISFGNVNSHASDDSLFKEVASKTSAMHQNVQSKGVELQGNYDSIKESGTIFRAGGVVADNIIDAGSKSLDGLSSVGKRLNDPFGNIPKEHINKIGINFGSELAPLESGFDFKDSSVKIKKGEKHN